MLFYQSSLLIMFTCIESPTSEIWNVSKTILATLRNPPTIDIYLSSFLPPNWKQKKADNWRRQIEGHPVTNGWICFEKNQA